MIPKLVPQLLIGANIGNIVLPIYFIAVKIKVHTYAPLKAGIAPN